MVCAYTFIVRAHVDFTISQVLVGSAAKLATADMPNMAIENSAAHKTFESIFVVMWQIIQAG
jgi:hypothetical protein